MPRGTTPKRLARAGFSPGLMSAGLGNVPAGQTYLDIGQGNRVFNSLYDSDLNVAVGDDVCAPVRTSAVVERAESAPAEIVPGPLATTLDAGKPCEVRNATLPQLSRFVAEKPKLVVAIERPPPAKERQLAIGISGPGFDGNLTSDSTRLDGYVLSTDVAPTILNYFGVPVPDEMSGQPIRSEGEVDPAAVESLGDRMAVISERRGPVIGLSLLAWLLALGVAAAAFGREAARRVAQVVGLSVVFLPLVLLLGAVIEPSEGAEIALTIAVSPLLAWLTLRRPRRLPGAGGGQRRHGARDGDRCHRRLAADGAFAARPQSRAGRALLRDRQ